MATVKEVVYWDSCVFIDLLSQQKPERYAACNYMQQRAENDELLIVTSAASIAEVTKLSGTSHSIEKQSKMILDYFENPYIVIRQVDRATANEAHEISRKHGLPPLDAIHVATALRAKVPVIYTYDGLKRRRKGLIKYNLLFGSNPALRIEMPPDPPPPPSDGPLCDMAEKAEKTEVTQEETAPKIIPIHEAPLTEGQEIIDK